MIAAYLSGERVVDIASRCGCQRKTLYAVLRAAGHEPSRHAARRTPPTPAHFCIVCGCPKPPSSSGHRSGKWFTRPSCGDPSCVSMLMYVPHKPSPSAARGKIKLLRTEEEISYEEMRAYDEDLDQSDVLEREFQGYADERGADIPESARKAPWGMRSNISIATMARSRDVSDVGMILVAPARERFLERFCGGDERYLTSFEIVYAWRCNCPEQSVFVVESFEDFPDDPGYYGACPRCGAVALLVEEA